MKNKFNIKATLEYDGTLFKGWQVQPGLRTVQGELEKTLRSILGHDATLYGSGRTDTGVHAVSQVANFHTDSKIKLEKLKGGVNSLTDPDMRVVDLEYVDAEFHARFSAISRSYFYLVGTDERSTSPFCRKYAWNINRRIDLRRLKRPLESLRGEYDFTNLSKRDPSRDNFKAIVNEARLKEWELGFIFEINANRFLPQMVRRIVGTLVAIGDGDVEPDSMDRLLETPGSPATKVYTAPPSGLFLAGVEYENTRATRSRKDKNESLKWDWRYLNEILH